MTNNEDRGRIELSLEPEVESDDWSGLPGWNGYGVPAGTVIPEGLPKQYDPTSLTIEADGDSSFNPDHWIWFMFYADDEPWFKLTYEEAEKVYDRLGDLLGK